MSYTSQGKLTFVSRLEDKKEWIKPADQLLKAPIKIDKVRCIYNDIKITTFFKALNVTYFKYLIFSQVRHIPKHLNLTEIRIHIATNLTCIENQPQQGKTSFLCIKRVLKPFTMYLLI